MTTFAVPNLTNFVVLLVAGIAIITFAKLILTGFFAGLAGGNWQVGGALSTMFILCVSALLMSQTGETYLPSVSGQLNQYMADIQRPFALVGNALSGNYTQL